MYDIHRIQKWDWVEEARSYKICQVGKNTSDHILRDATLYRRCQIHIYNWDFKKSDFDKWDKVEDVGSRYKVKEEHFIKDIKAEFTIDVGNFGECRYMRKELEVASCKRCERLQSCAYNKC